MEVLASNPDPGDDTAIMEEVLGGHTAHNHLGTAKTSRNQRKLMQSPLETVIL